MTAGGQRADGHPEAGAAPAPGGRDLPTGSGFAGDDGSADPALAAVLADYSRREASLSAVVAALAPTRVLVPVLTEVGEPGEGACHAGETDAPSGIVAIQAPDGRTTLPVFTSVATMGAWRPDARPYPAQARRAALSAVSEDWSLLVIDPGGPVTVVVPRTAVWALAQGEPWAPAVVNGVVAPEVSAAVEGSLASIPFVASAVAEPGRTAEVAIALRIDPGLGRGALDRVLAQVNAALAASETISTRVDSLELRIGRAA